MLSNFLASSKHIKGRLAAMNEDEGIETARLVVDKITVTEAGIDVVMDLDSGGVLSYGKVTVANVIVRPQSRFR